MSYGFNDPFRNYDQWLQRGNPWDQPEREPDRLICSECGDEFFVGTKAFEGHDEGEAHCVDEGEVVGRLEWGYGPEEDDGPDPDAAYDRMREEGW